MWYSPGGAKGGMSLVNGSPKVSETLETPTAWAAGSTVPTPTHLQAKIIYFPSPSQSCRWKQVLQEVMLDSELKSPCLHTHPSCRGRYWWMLADTGGYWWMPQHDLLLSVCLWASPCVVYHRRVRGASNTMRFTSG